MAVPLPVEGVKAVLSEDYKHVTLSWEPVGETGESGGNSLSYTVPHTAPPGVDSGSMAHICSNSALAKLSQNGSADGSSEDYKHVTLSWEPVGETGESGGYVDTEKVIYYVFDAFGSYTDPPIAQTEKTSITFDYSVCLQFIVIYRSAHSPSRSGLGVYGPYMLQKRRPSPLITPTLPGRTLWHIRLLQESTRCFCPVRHRNPLSRLPRLVYCRYRQLPRACSGRC